MIRKLSWLNRSYTSFTKGSAASVFFSRPPLSSSRSATNSPLHMDMLSSLQLRHQYRQEGTLQKRLPRLALPQVRSFLVGENTRYRLHLLTRTRMGTRLLPQFVSLRPAARPMGH